MREIKFRAWDKESKEILPWEEIMLWNLMWLNKKDQTDYVFQQFTGLKDKNGKEIYEGDICKKVLPYNRDFEIDNTPFQWHSLIEFGSLEGLEIIGNIYENPELLKDEK